MPQTQKNTKVEELSQIDQMKTKMLEAIYALIKERSLKQEDAAKFLNITQPRVSNIKNGVIHNFSIDKCITMLNTFGYSFNFEYSITPLETIKPEFTVTNPE